MRCFCRHDSTVLHRPVSSRDSVLVCALPRRDASFPRNSLRSTPSFATSCFTRMTLVAPSIATGLVTPISHKDLSYSRRPKRGDPRVSQSVCNEIVPPLGKEQVHSLFRVAFRWYSTHGSARSFPSCSSEVFAAQSSIVLTTVTLHGFSPRVLPMRTDRGIAVVV